MKLVLFGPQGSGKGTQAELLEKKFNIPHISTGDIFRDHMKRQTELGRKIYDLMNEGRMVPDEITNQIVNERLSMADARAGFILDGYPRDLNQAVFLDNMIKIDYALEIWISDNTAVERLGQRRSCPECGAVYHPASHPPEQEGVCDECGAKLVTREDDEPESIRQRLCLYHSQTEPLIKYYKDKGVYRRVDGEKSIGEVNEAVMLILNKS